MPKITLDSTDIDPLDTDARRLYMNVFFGSLPISRDFIQEARLKATELQTKHLAGQGLREVSEVYFEYHVDVSIWKLIMKRLMINKDNPWPWSVSLDENDLSQGASPVFREWCQSQADPRSRDQGPVPQSQAEAEQMALEAFQRAKEFDLEGFRLQLIARQWPSEDHSLPRDSHSDRHQTSGAPGTSTSGLHVRADDPSGLPHDWDDCFYPLVSRQTQPASWAQSGEILDSEVGRSIFGRM